MEKAKIFLVIVLAAALSACNSTPPRGDPMPIGYGAYPENYQGIVERYLDLVLKDPSSKKIQWLNAPRSITYSLKPFLSEAVTISGYGVCTFVNAKNSYGGYTGAQLVLFLIRDGSVVRSSIPSTKDWIEERTAIDTCKTLRG